ncbi:DUF998 domain-containing protein [Pseudomonas promysalinigenes]|uniref:DUF998 domain-containing protein n=1 Tax=Pseudomonas promysalinigenes TaxID=485898 RepID=UPI0037C95C39
MKPLDRALLTCAVIIPFWLLIGVWLTALAYPGYDHLHHAMSQLGATGAPTQRWSAWVNNFPLAVLFTCCAFGLARQWRHSKLAMLSAALVFLHGVGSLGTGVFACDEGCTPTVPSHAQQIHNLSGLLMFLSLTLACAIWVRLGKRLAAAPALSRLSLFCLIAALVTAALMAQAAQNGHLFGLYQRLNYGVSVMWVAALALWTLRQAPPMGLHPVT